MRWLKRPKIKRFFSFFFVYEVAVHFFGLFDVCVKQCPTINRNFILLSCSKKNKKTNKQTKKTQTSSSFKWDLVIQTQILTLTQQASYPLSCLHGPQIVY